MADLKALSPCAGLLPIDLGGMCLTEIDLGVMTTLAPFAGRQAQLSKALDIAHALEYPNPNRSAQNGDLRALWFGRDLILLTGERPAPELADLAAQTDQSDAWACVTLSGPRSDDVLARLVPIDTRPSVFLIGHTARTLIGHMNASITRIGPDCVLILVFRSMAATLVQEMNEAMEAVTAR